MREGVMITSTCCRPCTCGHRPLGHGGPHVGLDHLDRLGRASHDPAHAAPPLAVRSVTDASPARPILILRWRRAAGMGRLRW